MTKDSMIVSNSAIGPARPSCKPTVKETEPLQPVLQ